LAKIPNLRSKTAAFVNSKKKSDDMLLGYCSLSSSFDPKKLFSGAFNVSSFNQTEQKIHHNDGLTLYYTLE